MSISDLGRWLLIAAGILALVGAVLLIAGRLGLGHLPGDITVGGPSGSFTFPIVTCVIISLVLTVVLNIVLTLRR
jgi:hypothetical protein